MEQQPQNPEPGNNLQQQNPLPRTLEAMPSSKKRLNLQVAIIAVLGIILLATAGVLGYVLGSNSSGPGDAAVAGNPKNKEVANKDIPEEKVVDKYAGWKTFSESSAGPNNKKPADHNIHYDFKYPAEWTFAGSISCQITLASSKSEDGAPAEGSDNICFTGGLLDGGGSISSDDLVDSLISSDGYTLQESLLVDGHESKLLKGDDGSLYLVVDHHKTPNPWSVHCSSKDLAICQTIIESIELN